jgi:hypothetical protein
MAEKDYEQRIRECSQKALTAETDEARRIWKRMEEFWRLRAQTHKTPRRTLDELETILSPPTSPKR